MIASPTTLRRARWAMFLAWGYPAVLIASFYATWLMGWLILGHPPRPSLDDPAEISSWLNLLLYYPTGLILVGFPAAVGGGLSAIAWWGTLRSCSRWITLGLMVALLSVWTGTILFLRWDPLRVVHWFMD